MNKKNSEQLLYRAHLLEQRTDKENTAIINKLKRRARKAQ